MKKIYLLGFASLFALTVNAQTTLKIKTPLKKSTSASDAKLVKKTRGASAVAKNGGVNSINQIEATLVCNTPYVAGTTMDLNFTLLTTNTDGEWSDYVSITFPAGITPTGLGNTSDPFPTTQTGGGPEALNPVAGQTISWGSDNDDQFGGIWADAPVTLVVQVTIAPGTTGALNGTYSILGDKYASYIGGVDGDQLNSPITFNEQQASNLSVLAGVLIESGNASGCGLTPNHLAFFVVNNGTSNINFGTPNDNTSYTVNGGAAVTGGPLTFLSYTNPPAAITTIAPGDTAIIVAAATIDLSAVGTYTVTGMIDFVGSADGTASDNAMDPIVISNFAPHNVDGGAYTMGFESPADDNMFSGWTIIDNDGDGVEWAIANTYNHSGAQCLRRAGSGASGNPDDDWAITNCLDMTGGQQYDLTYYFKEFDLATPADLSVYYGTSTDPADLTNLVNTNALPADTMYQAVNVSITPATTGTYYIGFHVTSPATGAASIRIDDINLVMHPIGIKENKAVAEAISVYPNPSAGVFTIKAIETSSVVVYSVIGETVYTGKLVKGNNSVDLSNLAAGSYIVKVKSGNETISKRVVINK